MLNDKDTKKETKKDEEEFIANLKRLGIEEKVIADIMKARGESVEIEKGISNSLEVVDSRKKNFEAVEDLDLFPAGDPDEEDRVLDPAIEKAVPGRPAGCIICKKVFWPHRAWAKYCGNSCRQIGYWQNRAKRI